MYKTAVYMLVNGVIIHQKQQISKKCDITQLDNAQVSMYC